MSLHTILRSCVSTLFKGFQSSDRPHTEWARRAIQSRRFTEDTVLANLDRALTAYGPKVPDGYRTFVLELLMASIRRAHQNVWDPVRGTEALRKLSSGGRTPCAIRISLR